MWIEELDIGPVAFKHKCTCHKLWKWKFHLQKVWTQTRVTHWTKQTSIEAKITVFVSLCDICVFISCERNRHYSSIRFLFWMQSSASFCFPRLSLAFRPHLLVSSLTDLLCFCELRFHLRLFAFFFSSLSIVSCFRLVFFFSSFNYASAPRPIAVAFPVLTHSGTGYLNLFYCTHRANAHENPFSIYSFHSNQGAANREGWVVRRKVCSVETFGLT